MSSPDHSDAHMRAALHAQLDRLAFAHPGFFTAEPAEGLTGLLIAGAPEESDQVYLAPGAKPTTAIRRARWQRVAMGDGERSSRRFWEL